MVNHLGTTSQAGQDMFAHYISGRIHNGIFVDLGAHDGIVHSNSHGLEHMGWRGLCVDIVPGIISDKRIAQKVYCDAGKPNDQLKFYYDELPAQIGYLSVDCDDGTLSALAAFPFWRVQCQAVTTEHDRYRVGDGPRNAIRGLMESLGYERVCSDVVAPGYGQFEDWWAHPRWSSLGVRNHIRCEGKLWSEMRT